MAVKRNKGTNKRSKGKALKVRAKHGSPKRALSPHDALNTAPRLLKAIVEKTLDPDTLSKEERKAVVMLLADGTRPATKIARILRAHPNTIRADIAAIRSEVGRLTMSWGADQVIGQVVQAAEKASIQALQDGDVGLYWSINRDFARLMKELGVIDKTKNGEQGMRITIESIGEGYDRAVTKLSQALDPALTGEVIEIESPHNPFAEAKKPSNPPLPVTKRLANPINTPRQQVQVDYPGDDQGEE